MLDHIEDFIAALAPLMKDDSQYRVNRPDGEMYCPVCQGVRRMSITSVSRSGVAKYIWRPSLFGQGQNPAVLEPSSFVLQCLQCDTRFSVFVYWGPTGASMAIFPNIAGGLATKNTDKNVAYFLDQAYKCQSGGATTGAVLMYRAALEQLLTQQNYDDRNITDKIKKLEEHVKNGAGPAWVHDIDSAYLRVIKDLGNEGIHVNSGDTDNLAVFDGKLLAELHLLFVELLDLVYEKPIRKTEKLKMLQDVHSQAKP